MTTTLLCLAVLARWAVGCAQIVAYRFDWDPGEGLSLDYALRLLHEPHLLYPPDFAVPYPLVYTPLLTALLAPVVAVAGPSLVAARVVTAAIAIVAVCAAYVLGQRRGAGLLATALMVAPVAHSFWLVMLRVDGLVIALWLLAAVAVLDEPKRVYTGAVLIVLCVLAKPTGVLICAPLALRDRRLLAATVALGLAALGALQLATHGGFVTSLLLQTTHAFLAEQPGRLIYGWLLRHGLIFLFTVAVTRTLREPAGILWLSGPLSFPLLAKSGANLAYLLPWGVGQSVLAARNAGRWQLAGAAVATAVCFSQTLPTPSETDRRTAASLYAFVRQRGAPILAANPDYAYVVAGEHVTIEGTSFPGLAMHHEPGIQQVLDHVRDARYTLMVEKTRAGRIIAPRYHAVGACELGYFHGTQLFTLLIPDDGRFTPLAGSRCRSL